MKKKKSFSIKHFNPFPNKSIIQQRIKKKQFFFKRRINEIPRKNIRKR